METKLNYNVKMPEKSEKEKTEGFQAKNKTKLSMQSTVGQALASKMPQASSGAAITPPAAQNGWGRNA